jgi:hypothetical protein
MTCIFERKVLRKIFGPNYENGIWRIKTNQELDKIKKTQEYNKLHYIKRTQETSMVKAIHSWKSISKRPIGRPKTRWQDDS